MRMGLTWIEITRFDRKGSSHPLFSFFSFFSFLELHTTSGYRLAMSKYHIVHMHLKDVTQTWLLNELELLLGSYLIQNSLLYPFQSLWRKPRKRRWVDFFPFSASFLALQLSLHLISSKHAQKWFIRNCKLLSAAPFNIFSEHENKTHYLSMHIVMGLIVQQVCRTKQTNDIQHECLSLY